MKKKIKDLTTEDIEIICKAMRRRYIYCSEECPLKKVFEGCRMSLCDILHSESKKMKAPLEMLEEEIDIEYYKEIASIHIE